MHSRQLICDSGRRVTARLLLSFLTFSSFSLKHLQGSAAASELEPVPPELPALPIPGQNAEKRFALRHIFHHGINDFEGLHRRLDIPSGAKLWTRDEETEQKHPAPELVVRSQRISIQRLRDRRKESIDSILDVGRMTGSIPSLPISAWTTDEVPGPNVTDRETVLSFARMAANAYVLEPHTGDWFDVGNGYNYTEDFGWENDGLRGHIFADTMNSTVVIGLKGTSPAVFDGSETTRNDKINDNLFFSCCCGKGGQVLWKQVCDCQTSAFQCNSTCLVEALRKKNRYYYAARDLYHNVTEKYPGADVWMSGHSLGGALSAMLGLTYGLPVLTFEAVPDAMPASRLGLPTPPGHQIGALQERQNTGAYHFGHTADPVYMGACNKASSICTIAGYAMQSSCHTGFKCVYDTVKDFGWGMGIRRHQITTVIRDVYEKYDEVAKCEQYTNCTDCYAWEFHESNGTETTTSSTITSTSTSRTRTETCKTPGWWGCLDESTTTTTSTTSSKETSKSTTTCKTPGWFGCNDPTATSTTTKITTSFTSPTGESPITRPTIPASTSSCEHPGWFGCNDGTTTAVFPSEPTPSSKPQPSSTTCTSRRWFGLICIDPSPDSSPWQQVRLSTETATAEDRPDL